MPHAHPLVAIATPVCNGGKYLAETMSSVQAQTYPNLVHVLVDNASSDDTAAIIDRFRSKKVPLIVERNPETLPPARNWSAAAALIPSRAKYFSILSADDMLAPTAIQRLVDVGESDPAVELVGCIARRGDRLRPSDLPTGKSAFDGRWIGRRFLDKQADDLPHMYGLYRRHDGDFESDFFEPDLIMFDTDACLRALSRGRFGHVHQPLVTLRIHADQLVAKLLKESRHSVFEPLVQIERWAEAFMGAQDAEKCRARHLRAIYRFLLYWRVTGQTLLVRRYLARLAEHDASPSFADYRGAVAEWPLREILKWRHRRRVRLTTEALGFGAAGYPTDNALPSIMNLKSWRG